MDLNELLYQHQRAIIVAARPQPQACGSRFDLVTHYAERIRRLRVELGVTAYPGWAQKEAALPAT